MDKAVEMLQLRVSAGVNQLIDTHSEFKPMYFYLFPTELLVFQILFFILFFYYARLHSHQCKTRPYVCTKVPKNPPPKSTQSAGQDMNSQIRNSLKYMQFLTITIFITKTHSQIQEEMRTGTTLLIQKCQRQGRKKTA